MQQMIIANRLGDGRVVFLAPSQDWDTSIEAAAVTDDDAGAQRLLGLAKQHEAESVVVDPQLIEFTVVEGRRRPIAIREAIRAFGPTVRTDLDRA
jgi:hypothetical protein